MQKKIEHVKTKILGPLLADMVSGWKVMQVPEYYFKPNTFKMLEQYSLLQTYAIDRQL